MLRDITKRKQAEEALQQLTHSLEERVAERTRDLYYQANLLEHISDAVISVDEAMGIISWNKAAERFYGYQLAEVKGRQIEEVIPTTLAHSTTAAAIDLVAADGYWEGEAVQRRADGSSITVWASATAVKDESGRIWGSSPSTGICRASGKSSGHSRRAPTGLHALGRHLESVREEEQTRIAREVHDELGQILTVLKMDVSWLQRHVQQGDGEAVPRKLAAMSEQLSAAIKTVHRIAAELRPALLDNLGLIAAIEWLTDSCEERTGVACSFVHSGGEAEFPGQGPGDNPVSHLPGGTDKCGPPCAGEHGPGGPGRDGV